MADHRRSKPTSYFITRTLSMNNSETTPTRFELFNAWKEYQALILLPRRSENKMERIREMQDCMNLLFSGETKLANRMERIQASIASKRLTRSMSAKLVNLFAGFVSIRRKISEKSGIFTQVLNWADFTKDEFVGMKASEKLKILEEFLNSEILRDFVQDGNRIYEEIKFNLKICDRLL